jgi:hypothetical protein
MVSALRKAGYDTSGFTLIHASGTNPDIGVDLGGTANPAKIGLQLELGGVGAIGIDQYETPSQAVAAATDPVQLARTATVQCDRLVLVGQQTELQRALALLPGWNCGTVNLASTHTSPSPQAPAPGASADPTLSPETPSDEFDSGLGAPGESYNDPEGRFWIELLTDVADSCTSTQASVIIHNDGDQARVKITLGLFDGTELVATTAPVTRSVDSADYAEVTVRFPKHRALRSGNAQCAVMSAGVI